MRSLTALACVLAVLASSADAQVVGWRGDGTGKYPNAAPVVEWGRFPKSPVHNLRSGVNRPAALRRPEFPAGAGAEAGKDAPLIVQGLIKDWVMIGPFAAAEKDPIEHAYLAGEADLQPSENDKTGELEWKRSLAWRRGTDPQQSAELDWIYFSDHSGRKGENFAYAHAYLYAETAGPVVFVIDHGATFKMWVNGKVVYASAKPNLSLWANNNLSWGWGMYYPTPFGLTARREVATLNKGWNRALLKSNGNVHLRVTAAADAEYENRNIVWMSEMPDASNSSPIIVGDRIFVMAEPDELVCVDKRDGKILWRRSNSFFDAVPDAERAANPAYPPIAELMKNRMEAKTFAEKIVLRKQIQDKLEAIDKDKFSMAIEGHPTSHRPVAGWTTPTAFSDGKLVYAWVTNGVAACYDLDGNRKWITRVDLIMRNPGEQHGPYNYPSSPILIGGKFVTAVVYHGMVALNAADGSTAWVNRDVKSSIIHVSGGVVDGTEVVLGTAGEVVRVSDGKILWSNKWNSSTGPAVFENPVLYLQYLGYVAVDFSACKGGEWKPTVTSFEAPGFTTFSAPLVHQGLLYYVGREGELAVLDTQTKKTAYRRKLDVAPLLHYNAAGMCSAPTLGGKNVYLFDNQGVGLVLEPGREYKELARNRIETQVERDHALCPQETFYSNPIFEGTRMYLRGERYLYCIGQ